MSGHRHGGLHAHASDRIAPITLDGCLMHATRGEGKIDARTVFSFSQRDRMVTAHCAGGIILTGELIGLVSGGELQFRYVQLDAHGELDSGVSTCQIELRDDGGVRLLERFQWTSRPGGGLNIIEEEPRTRTRTRRSAGGPER